MRRAWTVASVGAFVAGGLVLGGVVTGAAIPSSADGVFTGCYRGTRLRCE